MPTTPSTSKRIYTACMDSRVKCRSSSHGSSHICGRNSAAVVCCYLVQTILTRSVCPVFRARQPCWTCLPLAGSVPISQEALDRAMLMSRSISTTSVSPLARQPCWTLLTSFVLGHCHLSKKDLDMAMLMSRFLSLFSYWSPTDLL
jgi:hypothetical protein